MDGPASKLTRTNSSLLRSSPTVRSSIHSLSSIADIEDETISDIDDDKKAQAQAHSQAHAQAHHYLSIACPMLIYLAVIIMFFVLYLGSDVNTTEVKLLFVLVVVALALFYVSRNPRLFSRCTELSRRNSGSVHWFIGEEASVNDASSSKVRVREGVEYYSNGDCYEGEFHRGKSNGTGVYTYNVNGRYEGEWVEGRYDGYGIESWAKGSRYRGMYRTGLRHGFGVYRFYTGDSFAGEWCNGQYHGVGVQSCSDGSCYFGEFKCGVKHGLGCYHFRNGDRYAGEYFGDKIHGFGVYHFANGHCYEGSWHEGRKQGYGMYTFRNGDPKCGEWNCGSLKTPLPPLTDSVLRAVQAARKAAENAINLRRVDEEVSRAVVGANRAATAARVAAVKAVQNRMDGKFYDTNA